MKSNETLRSATNPIIPIETFKEMHERWLDCPNSSIPDLFYSGNSADNGNQRVKGYRLEKKDLESMFGNVHDSDINIRFYLAANPDIEFGTVSYIPSFVPIVQCFNSANPPNNDYSNSFLPNVIHDSDSIRIPKKEAERMTKLWCKYYKPDLAALFQSEGVRVRFTTFLSNDSNALRAFYKENSENELILNIYCGFEPPTDKEMPYSFRIVLEIKATPTDEPHVAEYYEFSNPCPPLC